MNKHNRFISVALPVVEGIASGLFQPVAADLLGYADAGDEMFEAAAIHTSLVAAEVRLL